MLQYETYSQNSVTIFNKRVVDMGEDISDIKHKTVNQQY